MTTTIPIPARVPAFERPQGSPGTIERLSSDLHKVGARYDEFAERATTNTALLAWTGPAAERYRATLRTASSEHAHMASAVQQVARVAGAHADALREIQSSADDLESTRTTLNERRSQLAADVSAAHARGDDVTQAEVDALLDRSRSLTGDLDVLRGDIDTMLTRARDNEDLLRRAFTSATSLQSALSGAADADPTAAAALTRPGAPGTGASPDEVRAWWEALGPAEQAALIASYPRLLGNADGLPARVRDDANRVSLADDLATLGAKEDDGTISDDEQQVLDNARAAENGLRQVEGTGDDDAYVDPLTEEPVPAQLWMYDPGAFGGEGRVAISVGDLDTADDVAVRVPGITNEMTDAPTLTTEALNVYQAARYNSTDGSSVASMMWLGYDAPSGFTDGATFSEDRAVDGGGRLADSIDGLRASRDTDAHLTVIGHSYGSTTVSHSMTDHGPDVDDVVLVGSPGAGGGVDHADELGIGADHVYVGRNSEDPVAGLADNGWVGSHTLGGAGLGNDPSEDDFGAQRFQAEDPSTRNGVRWTDDHGAYFDPNSESLWNIGRIVDGSGDDILHAEHTYDPFWRGPVDPEVDRTPTSPRTEREDG